MKRQTYTRWAIVGEVGLYTGQHLTRRDAIADHIAARYGTTRWVSGALDDDQHAAWQKCQRKGDRAVKVKITVQ